jgi:hypothetical protein
MNERERENKNKRQIEKEPRQIIQREIGQKLKTEKQKRNKRSET